MADPKTVDGLKPDDVKKIVTYLGYVEKFLKLLVQIGFQIPSPLIVFIKRLKDALKAGQKIAEAAEEVAAELEKIRKAAISECDALDEEYQGVCEAKVERQYMFTAVKAVFNLKPGDPTSLPGALLKKALKEYKIDEIIAYYNKLRSLKTK